MGVNGTLCEQQQSASNRANEFGCRLRERVQRGWRWQISSRQARGTGLLHRVRTRGFRARGFVAASQLGSRFTQITQSVSRGRNRPRSRS